MKAACALVLFCAFAALADTRARDERLRVVEGHLASPNEEVNATDVVDEMIDELASDVARLGAANVGPVLLERVRLSSNLDASYAPILEARIAAALQRAIKLAVVRCGECGAVRARIEDGNWVVSRGIARREELAALGKEYGAQTLLQASLTMEDRPQSLALDVALVRAGDSTYAFAESYRLALDKALLYRGADSAQSREERLRMLTDRIDGRPRFAIVVDLGTMYMPADNDSVWGAIGRITLSERFGADSQHEAGLQLGGFLNFTSLAGGMVGAMAGTRLFDGTVFGPEVSVHAAGGVFITGNAGNSPYLGGGLRYLAGARIALHADVFYLAPFQLRGKGEHFGGVCPELGAGFVWR